MGPRVFQDLQHKPWNAAVLHGPTKRARFACAPIPAPLLSRWATLGKVPSSSKPQLPYLLPREKQQHLFDRALWGYLGLYVERA